jgi:predicted exporter
VKQYGWIFIIVWLIAGCTNTAPQRPSQRKGETPKADSTALALMELNQQMAQAADDQLHRLAQEQSEPYALYEADTWIAILDHGATDAEHPKFGQEQTVHMRTYDLSGHLLLDSEGTYRIGAHELPQAVDANICELYPHAKARLLAPWYAAYGLQGTDYIPPYENVMIELELK